MGHTNRIIVPLAVASKSAVVLAKGVPPLIGGIEAYSAEVADAYAASGWHVELVTPDSRQVIEPGTGVDRLSGTTRPRSQARSLFSVSRALLRYHSRVPDLVHATSWRMALPWLLMGAKTTLVITLHGREVTEQSALMRMLARVVLKRADLLVYVSEASRREIEDVLPALRERSSIVAWNGATATMGPRDDSPRAGNGSVRILTVCRLVRRKNLVHAVSAVAELGRRLQNVRLRYVIVGDGPLRAEIEAAAESAEAFADIELTGSISERALHDHYATSDVFFHPQSSVHDPRDIEGFGLTIVDAMAYGIPVVCGRDGGPSEYVVHGENGFLVSGTDLDESVQALERLVIDPSLRGRIGSRGKSLVRKKMTWSGHVKTITAALDPHAP